MVLPIEYCAGRDNVSADLLSRIHHTNTQQVCSVSFSPPFELDKIDVNKLRQLQREEFSKYYETADKYSDYAVKDDILYALTPPSSKHQHKPRVVLPSKYHEKCNP